MKRNRNRLSAFWYAAALVLVVLTKAAGAADSLYEAFQEPPAEARPFVRWWWNGNCVNEAEIEREIRLLHEAGIGGFEINPIAMPPVSTPPPAKPLTWLSPEWNRLVRHTARYAAKHDMIADLIVGSGWPFGAEFLTPEQMTQKIGMATVELTGPRTYTASLAGLLAQTGLNVPHNRGYEHAPDPELLFLRLAPTRIAAPEQSVDVSSNINDGVLTLEVPAGKHLLFVGAVHRGFSSVVHGAPGAMGPVLDHYNENAVRAFLENMSNKLNPVFAATFGQGIRAVFCDSIELSAANWTDDFPREFQRRRGYAVEPYLPYLVSFSNPPAVAESMRDTMRRVRYDFSETLVELFHERFVRTYHQWCHANNTLSRYQAYGSPWLMGMADGFLIPDIPETNNWLYSPNPLNHGYNVWTKYCSAGGHLKGRSIISTEAMTNTRGLFDVSLEQIKKADDFNFIMGVTHSVLHGFNFSPPSAGFPGWVRYGTYFSELNTWWPCFPLWSEYNARLSAVFQQAEPVVPVAILSRAAEVWSDHGLQRVPFHTTPWYQHQLWDSISLCGSSADYISERTLQRAKKENGRLTFGPMSYAALIVVEAETVQPETARALRQYAEAGGRIAFVGTRPDRSPSLHQAEVNDQLVRNALSAIMKLDAGRIHRLEPPAQENLLEWTDALIDRLDVERTRYNHLMPGVYQVRCRAGERDIFFIANQNEDKIAMVNGVFPTDGRGAWHWNPETGRRRPMASKDTPNRLDFILQPLESRLIVFEPQAHAKPVSPEDKASRRPVAILKDWQAVFRPVAGEPFTIENFKLSDLARSDEPRLNQFAGTISYTANYTYKPGSGRRGRTPNALNLGTVHGVTAAALNGTPLGTRWYGEHHYPFDSGMLQTGENRIEIRLTTTLNNYTRTIDRIEARRWYTPKRRQKASPAGMVGPVFLYQEKK